MVTSSVFIELSLLIVIAIAIASVVKLLKQPLIIGYILAGILVSPYFLDLIKSVEEIGVFAEMGVAVLLFMVGLHLNPQAIKCVGKISLITGVGQMAFTFIVGFCAAWILGFSYLTSAYIAIALGFSSTIIVMKLLSDKGDVNTLYGKISIGFLIVQDLGAIIILMIASSFSGGTDLYSFAISKIGIGLALLAGLAFVSAFVIKPVTRVVSKSQELLLLFSIGWAFALASLFKYFGFSIEIGALLAGVTLSVSPYRYEVGSRMKPLRDFFLLSFFLLLGSQLSFNNFGGYVIPVIVFSLVVLIGNPFIVMFLMGIWGYTKRNGFLAGLTVSQISEFSFILVSLGVAVGHVPGEILSVVTLVGLITMGVSSWAILHGNKIYLRLAKRLTIFERRGQKVDEGKYYKEERFDVILFGYNRIGYSLEQSLKKMKRNFLVVDNNPETIKHLAKMKVPCQYGDAGDEEMLDELPLANAKMVISTIPSTDVNLALIKKMRKFNENATIAVVSHQIEESLQFYEAGATYVITPHIFGGIHTSHLLERYGLDKKKFMKEGAKNANELLKRQEKGHRDVIHERD